METIASVALGAALAFSLAVPPGPINAMMAATSPFNRRNAMLIGLGAMTADAIFLTIVMLIHGAIFSLSYSYLKPFLAIVGGSLLVYLALRLLTQGEADQANRGGYLSGLFIGISNPYQFGWWISAGLTMISIFGYASIAGFFSALLLWVTAFPYALNKLSERYIGTLPKIIKLISVIALFVFGIYFILNGLTFFSILK